MRPLVLSAVITVGMRVHCCAHCVSVMLSSVSFMAAATSEIYTLSLHDALPICAAQPAAMMAGWRDGGMAGWRDGGMAGWRNGDRKSTRLNSSHRCISYAVFCLKKKISDS